MAEKNFQRRCHHEMERDILTTALKRIRKTNLFKQVKTNWGLFKNYLNILHRTGLIQESSGYWFTTEKGKDRLQKLEQLDFGD